jgi:diacylglycerol kinase (ATP)
VNVLGLGFDARVIAAFRAQRLRLPGKTGYFLSGFKELCRLKYHRITGELNGHSLKTEAMVVILGLGRFFGGGMMITPGASPQGAQFQVILGQKLSRLEVVSLLPRLYTGRHLDHPRVAVDYAAHIRIAADPPAYVEAEGELEGHPPLEAAVIPRALRIAAPSLSRSLLLRS